MKTPDEIKKALECCFTNGEQCGACPYYPISCDVELVRDAREYIRQLEAERDAAVSELVGTCQVCRWEETSKCASCHFCDDAWNVHESNWEWRGVQKEERQ